MECLDLDRYQGLGQVTLPCNVIGNFIGPRHVARQLRLALLVVVARCMVEHKSIFPVLLALLASALGQRALAHAVQRIEERQKIRCFSAEHHRGMKAGKSVRTSHRGEPRGSWAAREQGGCQYPSEDSWRSVRSWPCRSWLKNPIDHGRN